MKALKKMKERWLYSLVAMLTLGVSSGVMAMAPEPTEAPASGSDLDEVGDLANMIQAWMGGDLGMLILMVGLMVSVIMVIARASLMPALFVLGLAVILGWGPSLFAGILSMEVTPAVLAAAQ